MTKLALHWQILIAIILAAVAGSLSGVDGTVFGLSLYSAYDFVGTLFLNALKMIIVPLVMASIITGMASIGDGDDFGRLGIKTLLFYTASSIMAILVGLILVNIIEPGVTENGDLAAKIAPSEAEMEATMAKVSGKGAGDIAEVFIRMIPTNVVSAAANGQMLGMIFFSLLFGLFLAKGDSPHKATVASFWQGVMDVMTEITMFVMKFAPIGVFGLVAKTVASTGFDAFVPMLLFFLTVSLGLAIHMCITMFIALKVVGRVKPQNHYKSMFPALLTAFSTASSSATLPLTMKRVEEVSGVPNKVGGFVLPLGATVNMDGTALYECVAAMFIAQVYGIDLSFTQQFIIVLTALLTSIGVAGIPAASLVAISVILGVIGLPLEGIGLLLITDRILDMMRTAVNVFSDSCAAVIIARSEGAETNLNA